MRTLFTYVGLAVASALLLVSMALMPAGSVQSASPRPMALTASAEPPTPAATTTPPQRPTLPPTETPTVLATATPLVTATSTPLPPGGDPGSEPGIADPYVTKRANLDAVQVGDFVEFTLTVSNRGSATATDVVVVDPLPDFLTLYNATTTRGLISVAGNTVTIEIGNVEPGEIITITILTRVNRQVAPPDNRNTATLSTSSASDDPSNNSSSVSLVTTAAPTVTPTAPVPPTTVPPTSVPPTSVPPTAAPPTTVPPTSAPPTVVAPTAVSPATLPPTGASAGSFNVMILSLLLLAFGAAVAGLIIRRRSVR